MTRLFPERCDGKSSEAQPEIWQDWGAFAELAEQLQTYAEGLALAADNGLMMAGAGRGSGMMGGPTAPEELSKIPADGVFMMLGQAARPVTRGSGRNRVPR